MTTPGGSDTFYGSILVFRGFGSLMDPALYSPLPDDWTIGLADIVQSTEAIAENKYKSVNMAGAAVIAAGASLRVVRVATGRASQGRRPMLRGRERRWRRRRRG